MTPRLLGESQRAYVRRALEADGSLATWDCLYSGRYEDGSRFSITRLAAIIWSLRHEDHLVIDESSEPGHLAVYRLRAERKPTLPSWAVGWACASCGSAPDRAPEPLLGDMARAHCPRCDGTMFRRAA